MSLHADRRKRNTKKRSAKTLRSNSKQNSNVLRSAPLDVVTCSCRNVGSFYQQKFLSEQTFAVDDATFTQDWNANQRLIIRTRELIERISSEFRSFMQANITAYRVTSLTKELVTQLLPSRILLLGLLPASWWTCLHWLISQWVLWLSAETSWKAVLQYNQETAGRESTCSLFERLLRSSKASKKDE